MFNKCLLVSAKYAPKIFEPVFLLALKHLAVLVPNSPCTNFTINWLSCNPAIILMTLATYFGLPGFLFIGMTMAWEVHFIVYLA